MARSDVHRPSAIVPGDYEFVAFECMKIDDFGGAQFLLTERAAIQAHMKRTGGTYSRHQHGGNCHICGAHCIYTALFYHQPTNSYIRTGLDCTDKLDTAVDASRFKKNVAHALEAARGKRKAQVILERDGLGAAWAIFVGPVQAGERRQEVTIRDMVGKLVKYGSLSDKQVGFLKSLLEQIAGRAALDAQRAAEHAAAKPVPAHEERIQVEGVVQTLKQRDDAIYGFGFVMIVEHADGWKVMGSAPTKLVDAGLKRGDRVRFSATVKRSTRDDKFGFFSRPTKPEVVAA